jgi:PadR family transcriptional regulator, regulatory protein PadR
MGSEYGCIQINTPTQHLTLLWRLQITLTISKTQHLKMKTTRVNEASNLELIQELAMSVVQLTSLEETILTALTGRKLYGLQIINAFSETSGGRRNISIGTLYPILNRLEKQELISSEEVKGSTIAKGGSKRKFYTITPKGHQALSDIRIFRSDLHQWMPGYGNESYT